MCIAHIQKQVMTKLKLNFFTFQSPFHLDVHQEQRNHWLLQRIHDGAGGCVGQGGVNIANSATVPKGPNTGLRVLIIIQHFSSATKCGRPSKNKVSKVHHLQNLHSRCQA